MTMRCAASWALCATLWAAGAAAADWPCYLGANRDNTSADKNLTLWSGDNPKPLWKQKVGSGHSCMAVAGKHVYTQGDGAVWCLDAETGEVAWRSPAKGGGGETTATPAVDGSRVFALHPNHTLVCLDAADGKPQWSRKVDDFGVKQGGWALSCSPLVRDNTLVMDLGVVFLLDKTSGELIWKAGTETAGYASAVVFGRGNDRLVPSFNGAGLAVYTLAKGEPVAKYKWETAYGVNAATPIVAGGNIFISSGYGRGCTLLKLDDGELGKVWENKEMCNHCQTCVLAGDYLYGVHGQQGQRSSLKCLEFATGKVIWEKQGLPVGGGLTLADDKLFVMLDGGTLLVAEASPNAFKELARAKVLGGQCWTMPVVANGRVFCRSHDGVLVCLDLH